MTNKDKELTIMLSHPMNGKTNKQIEKERQKMIDELFEKITGNYSVITQVIDNHEEKSAIECLSESIYHMSTADILCMGHGWKNARGCKIEHDIAKAYDMPIIYLDDL